MAAAYGIDTRDPAVTPRRIEVLARRLPPQYGAPGEPWSTEAELLANLIDAVAYLTYATVRAAGGKMRKPRPMQRPRSRPRDVSRETSEPADPAGAPAPSWIDQLAAIPGVVVEDG